MLHGQFFFNILFTEYLKIMLSIIKVNENNHEKVLNEQLAEKMPLQYGHIKNWTRTIISCGIIRVASMWPGATGETSLGFQ